RVLHVKRRRPPRRDGGWRWSGRAVGDVAGRAWRAELRSRRLGQKGQARNGQQSQTERYRHSTPTPQPPVKRVIKAIRGMGRSRNVPKNTVSSACGGSAVGWVERQRNPSILVGI